MTKSFPPHPEKILIRSTNWIGDAVMTTPAIRTIRENFPESEISMLVHPWVSDVFRYSPRIDKVLLYEKREQHKGILGMVRLGRELRIHQFDCAILLQNAFEAAFITRVAKIPVRGGYTTDGRGLLLTHGVHRAPDLISKHQVHYYQRMVRGLGLKTAPNELELFIPGFQMEAARKRLVELANGKIQEHSLLVGLNPGAAFGPAKKWPAERYAAVADRICQQRDTAWMVIFGSSADHPTAEAILSHCQEKTRTRIIDLTGATSLIEAMALIGECDVFVTNDSGLMHVAAALHTPLVAIFGSTDHIATGPFSEKATIIRKPLPCSPCKKTHCPEKHFRCMRLITPDEVTKAVFSLLEAV